MAKNVKKKRHTEAERLAHAEAANARLAEAKAEHAAACEALRLAKVAVADAGEQLDRAKRQPMSCKDAAFKVLLGWAEARDVQQLVKEMAERGFWKSPKGVTPWATLYPEIIREIRNRGENSRFLRGERKGAFIVNPRFDPNA